MFEKFEATIIKATCPEEPDNYIAAAKWLSNGIVWGVSGSGSTLEAALAALCKNVHAEAVIGH